MTRDTSAPGALALAGALAYLVLAGVHVTHGTFDSELTSFVDYLNDSSFTIALLATIPALLVLRAGGSAPPRATLAIVIGQALVAVGVIAGLLAGESPSWFAAVGVPGNLIALAGWIAVARHSWKTGAHPRWVAVLMALVIPFGLIGGEFGGTIVPAALWTYLGLGLLRAGAYEGPTISSARNSRSPTAALRVE